MSENENLHRKNDEITVDANDRMQVEALHKEWKQFSFAQILEAIKKHGPDKKDIEKYLLKQAEVL